MWNESRFAPHLARGLVGAQTEESRMAKQAGGGPFGEADLGYESRTHPCHGVFNPIGVGLYGSGSRGSLSMTVAVILQWRARGRASALPRTHS